MKIIHREISWLYFNERVLQEANDKSVPLIERLRFLGIFSNNLDEFFRVRVGTLQRLTVLGKKAKKLIHENPKKILDEIHDIVIRQQDKFEETYAALIKELNQNGILIVNENQLNEEQGEFVRNYFQKEVRGALVPIMMDDIDEFPNLRDRSIYLAVKLSFENAAKKVRHALIEVPTDVLSRFLVLPDIESRKYVILLDDVIRFCLSEIFFMFPHFSAKAYTIKLTRDAELNIDDDLSQSLVEKISKGLKQRKRGKPVRFIYDEEIELDLFSKIIKCFKLAKQGDNLIPGGRYHNFKDFMSFPILGKPELMYQSVPALSHSDLPPNASVLSKIKEKDMLLHFPYHSFDHVIDLLREAAMDPHVLSIKITMYRLAQRSKIINALINAVKNGKSVTVVMELQARFDEEANINWSNRLRDEGAKVIFGVQGLKVHSKMILIKRKEKNRLINYVAVSTGNFNENTSRFYTDHCLLTADNRITFEVEKMFHFLENNYKRIDFKYLLVAPNDMRQKIEKLIAFEVSQAKKRKPASISIKLNNFVDADLIHRIKEAAKAGVKVRMIVRGTCALLPNPELKDSDIQIISIVDKYLEHSRFFIFNNGGKEIVFLSSADWMMRNLNSRVEMACPVFNSELKEELKKYFEIQFADNQKARLINVHCDNTYQQNNIGKNIRSQIEIYNYLRQHSS